MGVAVVDYCKNGKYYFTINQIDSKLIDKFRLPVSCKFLKEFCKKHCWYHSFETGGMGKIKMARCYEIHEVVDNLRYKGIFIPRSVTDEVFRLL